MTKFQKEIVTNEKNRKKSKKWKKMKKKTKKKLKKNENTNEKKERKVKKKCRWHGENLSDSRFCKKREKGNTVMVSQSQ